MQARQEVDPCHLWSVEALSGRELRCLLERARRLRHEPAQAPLRGRNLALLCDGEPDEAARALQRAAGELGAQVATLRASDTCPDGHTVDQATVRLLGRLYDAIDCHGLGEPQVEIIAREAGIPVFNGLGERDRPARSLAALLGVLERSGKPLEALQLGYVGDPGSDCARRWARLAATGGIVLRQVDAPEALHDDVDLLIDARNGQPVLTPAVTPDQREADRRVTLQAMLMTTMA
ncbi:MAG: hypothetical protein KIT35_23055 [Piscinibacter sp.]|uniref:hypothetical protein n=1 Tax=Piscinibacter TaxID=1114981 RepID=UPI000FDEC5A5|nr:MULTISPECIES: hypothetical protein [Piscinibacter]MCW5666722.1 hypothetical protein [Piscinibacter sp.]